MNGKDKISELIYRSLFNVTEYALSIVKQYIPQANRQERDEVFSEIKRVSHTQKSRGQNEYKHFESQEELIKFLKGLHIENTRKIFYRIKMVIGKYVDDKDVDAVLERIRKQLNELTEDEQLILEEQLKLG